MTTKHTPGPWYVKGAPSSYQHEQPRDIVSGHSLIAVACMLNNMRGETLANARLIAAAPDMLEALTKEVESLRREADWLEGQTRWDNRTVLELRLIESRLRAAIAKAEGRS